jgi:hypothetical protein
MLRLPKILVGMLTAAFVLGAATPTWGATVDLQQDKKPSVCQRDHILPLPTAQAEGRRVRESGDRYRHHVVPFLGIEIAPWRSAEPVTSGSVLLPLKAVDETRGKIANLLPDKSELIVKDTAGQEWKFFVVKDCKVSINGKQAKLSDLQAGDEVMVAHEMRGLVPNVAQEIRATRK